jgi:hypothetical protein
MTDWKKLRDEFFKECTDDSVNQWDQPIKKFNMMPHDVFRWFQNNAESEEEGVETTIICPFCEAGFDKKIAKVETLIHKRKDLNPEFLKSIDSIEENLKRKK